MRNWPLLVALGLLLPAAAAQQESDPAFRFNNPQPAFAEGEGPRVCVDEAHHNRHTIQGLFAPYAAMLRADGFRVRALTAPLDSRMLADCDVVILGNAQTEKDDDPAFWAYPHDSAFSRQEINHLLAWLRAGGRLLLFADHAPAAGAAAGLAAVLGLQVFDGWVRMGKSHANPEVIRRADGLFAQHPILRGVDSLAITISGAFFPSEQFAPLIFLGPDATGWVRLGEMGQGLEIPEDDWPRFRLQGWLLGGTRTLERGRVAVFGDVTACTAQLYGPERVKVGMNHPHAPHNARFCLNLVRWLADAPLSPPQSPPAR
jgi:hypothetical protein